MARNVLAIQRRDSFSSVIIAILAAILFPVFARAREKGRTASCQSNLKQIGLAAAMYTQDYDEYTCPAFFTTAIGTIYWKDLLQPYIKNTQVFVCPSNPASTLYGYGWNYMMLSYRECDWSKWHPGQGPTAFLGDIKSPSETIMAGDSGGGNRWYISVIAGEGPSTLHSDGANFAFVDGHVKWYKMPGVIMPNWGAWDCT